MRSHSLVSRLCLPLVLAILVATAGGAAAQPDGTGSAAPAADSPAPTAGSAAPAADSPAPPPAAEPPGSNPAPVPPPAAAPAAGGNLSYHSPMRPACEEELAKDKDWFANLKARLTEQINRNVHIDAARYATQNNKHVVAAYAVFWVLTAGFVLLMWRRQRALSAELARLERELARALEKGGGA